MPLLIKLIVSACLFVYVHSEISIKDYKEERAQILRQEALMTVGGNTTLNEKEGEVNNCLMQYKFYETDQGFAHPEKFNLSHHFFEYKDYISNSRVYHIIKDMPKGAVLHVHDMGILSPDYLLNLTYTDNLHVCFEKNTMKLRFSSNTPDDDCNTSWQLMRQARQSTKNIKKFDAKVKKHFSLVVNNPSEVYPTIRDSWGAFKNYFGCVQPLLSYKPIWGQYCHDALKEFRDNNVMYVEIRTILPKLYELDGTEHDQIFTTKVYEEAINNFVKDYPDFIGAKIIYAPGRDINVDELEKHLKLAREIKNETPKIMAGFDLTGQEDSGRPLLEFVPQLLQAKNELDYYFHAGETDWYGTLTDQNLVDAILLGAKRLGHAYAITKHPVFMEKVKERDIAIEVNLISNNVLSLLEDIRNHPLSILLASNVPVVISSDDPGAWGADYICDDYYVAFVAVASQLSDLRLLKQLAINSLKYSSFTPEERSKVLNDFDAKWTDFIENFNCSKYKVVQNLN